MKLYVTYAEFNVTFCPNGKGAQFSPFLLDEFSCIYSWNCSLTASYCQGSHITKVAMLWYLGSGLAMEHILILWHCYFGIKFQWADIIFIAVCMCQHVMMHIKLYYVHFLCPFMTDTWGWAAMVHILIILWQCYFGDKTSVSKWTLKQWAWGHAKM